MGSFHGDRELLKQRLGEGETGLARFRAVGLEVGGDDRDGVVSARAGLVVFVRAGRVCSQPRPDKIGAG